ncbi:DUF6115 domain-containing protein [Paenibacillus sp. GCM10012307]|uniref:Uncharacterized protein n=1 Tax=Paenibacillus roseus TaxID=2798579 RepID=A0A934J5T9_9BACL|nr:hypothetical protein [Paenibacillus roseus]MBJ6363405.1 hypothetical protein [Paenibacillus roseus]
MDQPWQYLVLLGAFVVVLAFILPKKPGQSNHSSISDMELALEQFMQTLETDNKEFLEMAGRTQQELRDAIASKEQRIVTLEHRCRELGQELAGIQSSLELRLAELSTRTVAINSVPAFAPPAAPEPLEQSLQVEGEDHSSELIKDRYAELLMLYNQGKSTDYIAKKLGLNKGEVQLIVQLSIQEERHRV